MKCCLCGKEISSTYGNNPWPLCYRDDNASRCCNTCNEDLVIKARISSLNVVYNDVSNLSPWNSTIAILWSSKSDKPIETFRETGKLLAGQVREIDRVKGIMFGGWGDFSISLKDDNWFIIDY